MKPPMTPTPIEIQFLAHHFATLPDALDPHSVQYLSKVLRRLSGLVG